jgi:hypothetical protein
MCGSPKEANLQLMIQTLLRITDETSSGKVTNQLTIEIESVCETLSVRELIRRRVATEVRRQNAERSVEYTGLIEPKDDEKLLNGERPERRLIDEDAQVLLAFEAFGRNGFLLFVDQNQVDELDDKVTLTPESHVSFVKLVALVGG